MRTIIVFTAAVAVCTMALADRQHVTFVTSERLKQICSQHSGTFWDDGSGYSCSKECGKKGRRAWCAVDCNSETRECVGRAPGRVAPAGDIQHVLNN